MKSVIRVIIYTTVFFMIFLPTWASTPGGTLFSDKLASLDIKMADLSNNLSDQYKNTRHYAPTQNPWLQVKPVSEPVTMLLLGAALIGFSIVGRKMIEY